MFFLILFCDRSSTPCVLKSSRENRHVIGEDAMRYPNQTMDTPVGKDGVTLGILFKIIT